MTAGEVVLHRSIRRTARVNWRVVTDAAIEIACVAIAVFAILYCWMTP